MKKINYLFLTFLLSSCVQDSANIVFKEGATGHFEEKSSNNLQPSYMSGTYVVGKDNKVVRDIRANNTIEDNYLEEKKETKKEKENVDYIFITVKKGDNIIRLAKKYNMKFSDIVELNNLKKPYNIYIGQKLKVFDNADKEEYKVITVKKGDTLLRIALKYDMSLREVATINNIEPPYNVYVGQKIKIPNSKTKLPEFYAVEIGDNLYGISRKTGVSVEQLIKNNNLKSPNNIHPGQKLYLAKRNDNYETNYKEEKVVYNKKTENKKEEVVKKEEQNVIANVENNDIQQEKKESSKSSDVLFSWPVKGEVIKKYGKQSDGKFYDAINIRANLGTPILAAMDGEVAYAGNELKGYGNIIIIKHNSGWLSIYGYCDKINVKVKDKVTKGQVIATVGRTGNVNEAQLYFSVRKGRVTMDPLKYLSNN